MPADYSIIEHIPVADHVYKYLIKKCGTDRYIANRSDFIGNVFLSTLSKNNDVKIAPKPNYTKVFNVIIKEESYTRQGFFLGVKHAQVFNTIIDKMFREELFTHMIIIKEQGKDLFLQSMRNFLNVYNITEDDIKYETLYRDFKRKKDAVLNS